MTDFFSLLEQTKTLSPVKRREALKPYADRKAIGSAFLRLKSGKDVRLVLRALSDLCAYPAVCALVRHNIDLDPSVLEGLFSFPDAKARKNLYELVGKTQPDVYFPALSRALLSNETTEFNLPSLILAIGNCKNKAALPLLKEYRLPPCAEKHEREAKAALAKALSHLSPSSAPGAPAVASIPPGTDVFLSCSNAGLTAREMQACGFSAKPHPLFKDFVVVKDVKTYASLFSARTFFSTWLFYAALPCDTDELCRAAAKPAFGAFLKALFPAAHAFRVEIAASFPGLKLSRADVSWRVGQAVAQAHGFSNNPSAYQFTLVLYYTKKSVLLFAAPAPALDRRFAYREKSVSASISPAAAATCMYAAKDYFRPESSVLDCFCGAGTMLFERAQYPYARLTGSDLSTQALAAARFNARRAQVNVEWLLKNAISPFREQYDEVVSNMPFGLRVSNHEKNTRLYREFFANLCAFLKPGGYAFLFTQEKKLFDACLAAHPALTPLGSLRLHTGGLYPNFYLLQKK